MQTFLPYPNFHESATCLDNSRLGKQRLETKQILEALEYGGGWCNHPAARMWEDCEHVLACYGLNICIEWRKRGFRDGMMHYFEDKAYKEYPHKFNNVPSWLGDYEIHQSHRARLLAKGEIDRIRWRIRQIRQYPDSFCYSIVGRECRDLLVKDFYIINAELNLLAAPLPEPNHYDQFGWFEFMADNVKYPNLERC